MANNAYIPRPEKFAADSDIAIWFHQFELFLQLSAVTDANRLNVLLTYLDLPVFQATVTALDITTATFQEVKTFLLGRYSTCDAYMERVSFFENKFSHPAGAYAAWLSSAMDKFSQDAATLREEILVAKFISSSQGTLASELRLRRPTTLNACVQISNSLATTSTTSSSCMLVSPPHKLGTSKLKKKMLGPVPDWTKICFRCGSIKHIACAPDCLARNSECGHCHKVGHWRKVCKSFQFSESTAKVRVSSVTLSAASVSRPTIPILLGNAHSVKVIVDTGAEVSFLNAMDFSGFNSKRSIPLQLVKTTFHNFDGSRILVRGCVSKVATTFNNKSASCTFYIANVPHSIIGMDVISALRLSISCDGDSRVAATTADFDSRAVSEVREETAMSIKLKDGSPSTLITPVRRLPFALETPVEHEIRKLLAADVIESISTSPFVSPIVVTTKRDNSIRLCVDYRRVNSFTIPDQYPIPSVDELFSKIPGNVRYFSKIDLKAAYHQVDLNPDSRDYTAFITHVGLFRYKKIPYGLVNAPAAFTRLLQRALQPCDNVIVYFDDILCFGSTKTEHDVCLGKLKSILQSHNLVINESKSQYNVESIEFLGRQLSANGIKPPIKGVQAIRDCLPPTTKAELRSFLGMAGYYRTFIKDFSTIADPLTCLLKEDVPFHFDLKEQVAFDHLKQALLKSPFLAFFDTDASVPTFLTTDASGVGLGAVLSQIHNGIEKPVYFVSRKLHPNETRFSSAELETLAVVWAVERLHQYVYGRKFEIRTDHSALREVLMGGRKNSVAPARITRWASRLLPYVFSVSYIKGRTNMVADCLSRLPTQECDDVQAFDVNIAAIQGGTPPCLTLAELSRATAEDGVLQNIINYISTQWPQSVSEDCQHYFRFRDEFSVLHGLLLRGEKIVVPSCLQQRGTRICARKSLRHIQIESSSPTLVLVARHGP